MKKPIIHKGENGCMSVAFYLVNEDAKPDSLIKNTDIELLKGGNPNAGDPMICGTCGKGVYIVSTGGWCK